VDGPPEFTLGRGEAETPGADHGNTT